MSTETWQERARRRDQERRDLQQRLAAAGTLEDRGRVMDEARAGAPYPFCPTPVDCYGRSSCPKRYACSE